ncbi:MAG: hypothetical protein ACE365_07680 [Gammaproteobacteria bacterium]
MKNISFVLLLFFAFFISNIYANVHCENYPHWKCNNAELVKIDQFLQKHANKGYVAAFDWDGTLYEQDIVVKPGDVHAGDTRSGQSIWHLWGAKHGYFPEFVTRSGKTANNVALRDDYIEGKTNISADAYSKFSQIAVYEAGMTPEEMHQGVSDYAKRYPPKNYGYFKMLDVMQAFKNHGYQVWIVTGSNPYFIATLLENLDQTLGYNLLPKGCDAKHPRISACHIAGNEAKLSPNGKFTMVYDDRFVDVASPNGPLYLERNIVDGPGKTIVMKNYIKKKSHKPIVFYAGNSGGDYEIVQYVLNQSNGLDAFVVAVNPVGTLTDLVKKYVPQGKLAVVSDQSKVSNE